MLTLGLVVTLMNSGNDIFSTPMHVLVFEDYVQYWVLMPICRYLCNVMTLFHSATVVTASKKKIKSSLNSPYYAEACNELRGPSPRLSAWATQLRRNVATVASRWRHCVDLTGPGIEPQTSRTDSVRLATELTAGLL